MAFKDIKDRQAIIKAKETTSENPPREPHYWGLCANPKIYKVRDAVYERKHSYWVTGRSDVRKGDFAAIWQSSDDQRKRGIVAFSEILSDPVVLEDHDDPYWIKRDELQKQRRRVPVKFHISPFLPLWVDDSPVGNLLRSLSVAKSTGGTVFHITSEQWEKLMEISGLGKSPVFMRERVRPAQEEATLEELREKALEKASPQATLEERLRNDYERSDYIRLYALKRAGGRCEGCGENAPFMGKTGAPYLEVHHLKSLWDEGPDAPENVIALCPTCHRRVHNGIDGNEYNRRFLEIAWNRFIGKS